MSFTGVTLCITTRKKVNRVITYIRRSIFVLLLLVDVAWAVTPTNEIGFHGFTKRTWGIQDGLPDQSINALAQTADGNLWIGTKGGLVRFDGAHFTAFTKEIAPALLDRGINCLLSSSDGSLWIGTEGGGLLRYRDNTFQTYSTSDKHTNEFIRAIYEDHHRTIWVGSDQGLFRVSGTSIVRVDDTGGTPSIFVHAFTEDNQGRLWVAGTALMEFEGGKYVRQYPLPGGPNHNAILSIFAARDGTVWAGTLFGLQRVTNSGAMLPVPGISAQVSVIRESIDGTLWVGTKGSGLFIYRDGRFSRITSDNLASKTVGAVLEDREHNLWMGTREGLVQLSRSPVEIVPFPGGSDSEFETLYRDTDGSIWVANSTHLYRIQKGIAVPWSFPGLNRLRVKTMLRDKQGHLWIGTDGSGLLEIGQGRVRKLTTQQGLTNNFVRAILQIRDGSIWVGTDGGLSHIRGNEIENFKTEHGLAYFSIMSLFEDRDGDIWIGTCRGLSHFSHGVFVNDVATHALGEAEIWTISQDAAGYIWFGTNAGLYGFNAGKLVHLTTAQGLANNTIYQILDDQKGNVWLSGPNSISRLRLSELDAFADGAAGQVRLTSFLDSHDLDSGSLYAGMQPEGAITPSGDVWFPGTKGAVRVAVDHILPEPLPHSVIEKVTADGETVPLDHKVVLGVDNGRLEISYSAISLRSQKALRFRYRMEGLESWSEANTQHAAYYTHLPAGTYRFRVQSFEIDNPGTVSESSIVIVQNPHFYATPWFVTCCVAALLGTLFLIYRLRLRQMQIRFQTVAKERARLAREMHDTVIQNCVGVSSLLEAVLSLEAKEEPLRTQLLCYASDQVRVAIESAREAVWALRHPFSTTTDIGHLCDVARRELQSKCSIPISCIVTGAPHKLGDSATHEVMMTVREALANAVQHANPTKIAIAVSFLDRELEIEIRNDGRSFDPNTVPIRKGHFGIVGMRERVHLLGGSLNIVSMPGCGTEVRISIPHKG